MKRCLAHLLLLFVCSSVAHAQDTDAMKDSINDLLRKVYYQKNKVKFDNAKKLLEKAEALADSLDDDMYRVDCYNLNAQLDISFEKYNFADQYLNISDLRLTRQKYPRGNVIAKGLRSELLAERKQFYEAITLLRETKGELKKRDKAALNRLAFYEGIVHFKRKDFEQAKNIFENLSPFADKYEKYYLRSRVLTYLSEIYFNEGEYEEAGTYAANSLKISNSRDFPKLKKENHRMLSNIFEAEGDFKKAFYHLTEAEKIEHNILNPGRIVLANTAETENQELAFLKRMTRQLQNENAEQQQQVNMSKLTSVLSSALLIIISLLTISLYRNNQIKFKTNDLLLKKNLELETARDEAERAMQAKGQFLSTVSHELRTPLYAVTGLTHLLLEENPSESQKEHLKSLKFSGEYLLNFINDILQINKIEAKKLSVQKIPFNLKKVLKDVVDSLHQTAKENNNTIDLNIDRKLPKELLGDPLKLSQILINLIGNASKFTHNGKINVAAGLVNNEDEKVGIHFEVQDNGIGISKELQDTIFESFAQGSIQINRKYGGTGLGLTIVKSLLSLFDSEIKLESELGKGSTFMFDIYFDIPAIEEKPPVEETKIEVKDEFFENMHLLVVEDNKINQVITKKMLVKKGMTCDIANDGYEAIEKAKSPVYNAILMDIHMPGISGLTTTKEIRKFNKKVPIIALTAISLDENTDDFYEAGCNDVITKPFKPETFYEKIGNNILKNIEVNI
ncbi:response regulator [Leptobacterium flavescens]|uniref:histidine kinase n=1 Tax=Leptobacterium flavescens TaxID=472055 RepID=A0A6P0UKI6_9FLAO|nr:response regulator [Leptobacterium flavescens]NER12379.1 response regulator [Leptobacterium flavescens]